jgi:hypothetical protein
MQTITKERLHRIGIQDDVSLTIKPSSIIIPIVASYIVVAAAVIIYLFLQMGHHGIVSKIQYNGCDGCALGSWSGRNGERGADWDSKASELRESYMSDVPRIHGEAA